MLGSVGMMLVVSLVFIDRDLITINHARVCGHDAGCVISVTLAWLIVIKSRSINTNDTTSIMPTDHSMVDCNQSTVYKH
jgi:hypothetical protein